MSALVTVRKGACPDSCVNLPLKSNMLTDHFGRFVAYCYWHNADGRPNRYTSNLQINRLKCGQLGWATLAPFFARKKYLFAKLIAPFFLAMEPPQS